MQQCHLETFLWNITADIFGVEPSTNFIGQFIGTCLVPVQAIFICNVRLEAVIIEQFGLSNLKDGNSDYCSRE